MIGAMTDQKNEPTQDQKPNDAQFRAVVKRLLDTPPQHKASKASPKVAEKPNKTRRARKPIARET